MAYFPPYIDSNGFFIPTYKDVRDELITEMKTIFGNDIYIEEDSMDYQQISIFAKKIFDAYSLALLVYNNRTVNTASGIGLDNMCALVGIVRKAATYSTVQLVITGQPSTVISNGKASDVNLENTWNLPETITIPDSGTITVEATCDAAGNITAAPNTITRILTPVYGWTGVVNNVIGSGGTNVETDAELRGRYALAVAAPAQSVFESLISSVTAVSGVTRVKAYENDTGSADANGLPAHSVTFIVEGGDDNDVATEIYYKKTPGCYTNGTTSVDIISIAGNTTTIRFYRPTYKNVYVKVFLKKLSTYNDSYVVDIQTAIRDYVNGMNLAENVYRSILWSVATSQMKSIDEPAYSITDIQLSTNGTTFSSADIQTAFNEAALINALANVQVEVS